MHLLAATLAFALTLADVAPAAWQPPVPGAVTQSFDLGSDPFEAGRHRGVDLAAPPGTTVRSPCAGPVAFAGAVGSSGRVVTLVCDGWRVTHMPLASIAVRPGATVRQGASLGTLAASRAHTGLHLGVRRDGTRFGYADPLRFLGPGGPSPAPPLGRAPRPARPPRSAPPRPPAPRPLVAPPRPLAASAPTGSNQALRAPFAPWPAWLGLAFVLAGAGLRVRTRARKARVPAAAASPMPR